jgi:putative mRNA 3-end processing factor
MAQKLLEFTPQGIWCPQADVYIDPWRPVDRAIITHAHSDHARWGMKHYLAQHDSIPILRQRLGEHISVQAAGYGEAFTLNGVRISLHPAGHVPGSAQVRLERGGEVWVVSGDYKLEDDGLSAPFEAVRCQHFITESTFGLPVYHWQPQAAVIAEVQQWWAQNAALGVCSLLIGYALGKSQRMIQALGEGPGPVFTHGAIEAVNRSFRAAGIAIRPTEPLTREVSRADLRQSLVIAPPNAIGSPWARKLEPYSLGIASGWMALRGARRRRAADRGFILSDHADWAELNRAVAATGAEQVYVTHGYTEIFARWLREQGLDARTVETQFEGELAEINESTLSAEEQGASAEET